MLDKERILTRIADIEQYTIALSKFMPNNLKEYNDSNNVIKAACERYLQLINDLQIEVLALVYKGLELGIVGEDISLINTFESKINKKTLEKLKQRRALRNMLVHAYYNADYNKEVFAQSSNVNDVLDFIKQIKNIISK